MYNAGLILEGGGMRGVFTAGVLDFFIDKNIEFSSCYGVSAGACHCCSYISKQRNRAFDVNVDYLKDKRYASFYSLLTTGNFFGVDFVYGEIPTKLNAFDYDTYEKYKGKFYAVATDCLTGKPQYFDAANIRKNMDIIVATSSLPMLSKEVFIDKTPYLDGGVSDSVPVKKSVLDGNEKNVVVLTRNKGYRKSPNKFMFFIKLKYKKYPKLIETIENRHIMYNDEMDYIERGEKEGSIFVIRPTAPVNIGRIEKNREKLTGLYKEGIKEAEKRYEEMMRFLEK